jgi:ribonuclease J
MRVCIHRGTKEIGGTCIEVESGGRHIVVDVGLPLDLANPDEMPLHPIGGFDTPDPSLLGVVISHPHQDHYALAYRLPPQTLFLIGKAARSILAAAEVFTPGGVTFDHVKPLRDRTPITLGPFTITPFLVDHSAYDAYAILVEADGKRLFYSGDLRAHGRNGALFTRLVSQPPEMVDVLLMEGTTIGRENSVFPTEAVLETRFVELCSEDIGNAARVVFGPKHRQARDGGAGVYQSEAAIHHRHVHRTCSARDGERSASTSGLELHQSVSAERPTSADCAPGGIRLGRRLSRRADLS